MYSTRRNQKSASGTDPFGFTTIGGVAGAGSVFRSSYTEMQRYAIETGSLIGPAKVSLMGARIPGLDRRHGVLIDKQGDGINLGAENGGGIIFLHPELSNTVFLNPYSYLMVFQYGGGNGAIKSNGDGMLVDANALAARLDYAVAANLNLWGSVFYAERASHGYGWGFITPNVASPVGGPPGTLAPPLVAGGDGSSVIYQQTGTFAAPSPAIPDRSLGYEIGGGVDWALLEGLRFNARASYWIPGKWFNYACVSRTNPSWATPAPTPQASSEPSPTGPSIRCLACSSSSWVNSRSSFGGR